MKTFGYDQVKELADSITAKLDRECETAEGTECIEADEVILRFAKSCCEFADALRKWARDVFTGEVAFDATAEQLWKAELSRFFVRAQEMLAWGGEAESLCYELEGMRFLKSVLWSLNILLIGWVTPKLSVGPSARVKHISDEESAAQIKSRIASLPKLSKEWRPVKPLPTAHFVPPHRP